MAIYEQNSEGIDFSTRATKCLLYLIGNLDWPVYEEATRRLSKRCHKVVRNWSKSLSKQQQYDAQHCKGSESVTNFKGLTNFIGFLTSLQFIFKTLRPVFVCGYSHHLSKIHLISPSFELPQQCRAAVTSRRKTLNSNIVLFYKIALLPWWAFSLIPSLWKFQLHVALYFVWKAFATFWDSPPFQNF